MYYEPQKKGFIVKLFMVFAPIFACVTVFSVLVGNYNRDSVSALEEELASMRAFVSAAPERISSLTEQLERLHQEQNALSDKLAQTESETVIAQERAERLAFLLTNRQNMLNELTASAATTTEEASQAETSPSEDH